MLPLFLFAGLAGLAGLLFYLQHCEIADLRDELGRERADTGRRLKSAYDERSALADAIRKVENGLGEHLRRDHPGAGREHDGRSCRGRPRPQL